MSDPLDEFDRMERFPDMQTYGNTTTNRTHITIQVPRRERFPLHRSGRLQARLQRGRLWRIGNLISTARFGVWWLDNRSAQARDTDA